MPPVTTPFAFMASVPPWVWNGMPYARLNGSWKTAAEVTAVSRIERAVGVFVPRFQQVRAIRVQNGLCAGE